MATRRLLCLLTHAFPDIFLIPLCRSLAQMGAQRGRRTRGGGQTRGGLGRPRGGNRGIGSGCPAGRGGCGPSNYIFSPSGIHLISICLMMLQVLFEGEGTVSSLHAPPPPPLARAVNARKASRLDPSSAPSRNAALSECSPPGTAPRTQPLHITFLTLGARCTNCCTRS